MKATLTSIKIFGLYSFVMGAVLLLAPGRVLPLFHITIPIDAWVRMLGLVLICSSYYYNRASFSNNIDFAVWTIHTRLAAPVVLLLLFLSGSIEKSLLPSSILDALGGVWTLLVYQKEKKEESYASR